MVEVQGLTYTYPAERQPALQDLTLALQAGEQVLLTGPSGAGKTTLLRALNGLVPHFHGGRFRGRVRVAGLDTRRHGPAALAAHVGTLFQQPARRFLTDRAEDEIALALELAGLPPVEIHRRLREAVDRLDLAPLLTRPLQHLSGGEQQRVALAVALARGPSLLLLDEPFSQLDPPGAQAALAWTLGLAREEGLALLLAEHRLDRLVGAFPRLVLLDREGRLAADGPWARALARLSPRPALWEAAWRLGLDGQARLDTGRLRQALAASGRPAPRTAAGPPRLVAQGLRLGFEGHPVLQGVDLEVREGEVLALLGRNGAGKTTLLRALMGLLTPEAGRVLLDGQDMTAQPPEARARRMAYLPQWPEALLFAESVREELAFTLRQHGLEAAPSVDPEALLGRLGLAGLGEARPRDLSAGQRQRAALAAVLVAGPEVLLLDEPTLGMDPAAKADLGQLLREWAGRGASVLVATHDVEFVAAYADRAALLEAGRVVTAGPAAETLFARPAFRTALQRLTGHPWPASPAHIPASHAHAP